MRRRFFGRFGSGTAIVPPPPPPPGTFGQFLFNLAAQSGLLALLEDI
jgi:hypothetical protein